MHTIPQRTQQTRGGAPTGVSIYESSIHCGKPLCVQFPSMQPRVVLIGWCSVLGGETLYMRFSPCK